MIVREVPYRKRRGRIPTPTEIEFARQHMVSHSVDLGGETIKVTVGGVHEYKLRRAPNGHFYIVSEPPKSRVRLPWVQYYTLFRVAKEDFNQARKAKGMPEAEQLGLFTRTA